MTKSEIFSDAINEVYKTRGKEAFENPKLFNAVLDDLLPALVNERKMFRSTIDNSLLNILYSILDGEIQYKPSDVKKIKSKLKKDYGLSEKESLFIAECFANVAGVQFESNSGNTLRDTSKTSSKNRNSKRTTKNTTQENLSSIRNYRLQIEDELFEIEKWLLGTSNLDSLSGKKYSYENGDTFEGVISNGKRTGMGKYTYANGDVFEGEYKDDVPNGAGKYYYINGDIFEGEYKDGKQHGKGKYTWKSTGCFFEGEYLNGQPIKGIEYDRYGAEIKKIGYGKKIFGWWKK